MDPPRLPGFAPAEWCEHLYNRRGAKHEALSASDVKCMQACIQKGATPVPLTGGDDFITIESIAKAE